MWNNESLVLVMPFTAGVGGIEAEAVMLGQPISMVLPQVIGYRLMGKPHPLVTSTDIVLTITKVTVCLLSLLLSQTGKEHIMESFLVSRYSRNARKQYVDNFRRDQQTVLWLSLENYIRFILLVSHKS